MKYKTITNKIDLNVLVMYDILNSLIDTNCYSKEIEKRVNSLLKYLYLCLYPYEKNIKIKNIISSNYYCKTIFND